jgi:hypothetical protein
MARRKHGPRMTTGGDRKRSWEDEIVDKCTAAINMDDMLELRAVLRGALLLPSSHDFDTDQIIHKALLHAANNGSLSACRVICEQGEDAQEAMILTSSLRQEYSKDFHKLPFKKYSSLPLLEAAGSRHWDIMLFLLPFFHVNQRSWITGEAIEAGREDILLLLLREFGAVVPAQSASLFGLLADGPRAPLLAAAAAGAVGGGNFTELKLSITRVLVRHAATTAVTTATGNDNNSGNDATTTTAKTAAFLQHSLLLALESNNRDGCVDILLEAGVPASSRALYCAIEQRQQRQQQQPASAAAAVPASAESMVRLLLNHGADPFIALQHHESDDDDDDDDEQDDHDVDDDDAAVDAAAVTPLHAAARKADAVILRLFLPFWNNHISRRRLALANDGDVDGHDRDMTMMMTMMNGNVTSPLHALVCDKQVSIQAVKLLVQDFKSNVSERTTTTGVVAVAHSSGQQQQQQRGLLPFHLAVMSGASLDVVFFLLTQHPDALTD